MDWLIGGAEVVAGAASVGAGAFLTWAYRDGPADLKHIVIIPIIVLLLIVIGFSVFTRGSGIW